MFSPSEMADIHRIGVLTKLQVDDNKARSDFRRWATFVAMGVIAVLALLLVCTAGTLVQLSMLTPSSVGFLAALVAAITVLVVSLLRSTFAPPRAPESNNDLPLPALGEAAKALVTEVAKQAVAK
jgi:hypothetical protein